MPGAPAFIWTSHPARTIKRVAQGEALTGRPSMVERALDADERVQLQVFRAATEPNAPLYAAVLSLLVTAKERYQVQVRTEDIAQELSAAGWEVATLTATLEQLKDWGAVSWTQDTSRVARLEDFHRRRELWQLTPAGHVADESVLGVLGAAEQAGSLQRRPLPGYPRKPGRTGRGRRFRRRDRHLPAAARPRRGAARPGGKRQGFPLHHGRAPARK